MSRTCSFNHQPFFILLSVDRCIVQVGLSAKTQAKIDIQAGKGGGARDKRA
jgi:hypothetical protein